MAVDAETRYPFNSFPYLGKDGNSDTSICQPKYVVTKLMQPIFKRGYNVTYDNFFTSLDVALNLADQKCGMVGTVRQNRKELPEAAKKKTAAARNFPVCVYSNNYCYFDFISV